MSTLRCWTPASFNVNSGLTHEANEMKTFLEGQLRWLLWTCGGSNVWGFFTRRTHLLIEPPTSKLMNKFWIAFIEIKSYWISNVLSKVLPKVLYYSSIIMRCFIFQVCWFNAYWHFVLDVGYAFHLIFIVGSCLLLFNCSVSNVVDFVVYFPCTLFLYYILRLSTGILIKVIYYY